MVKEAIEKELADEWKLMKVNLLPPTDNFIAALAKEQNLPYTVGKKGTERFYSDDGNPIYPPNNGAIGKPETVTLQAGDSVYSRYGGPGGSYVSPDGTSFEERALPANAIHDDFYRYVVIADIAGVEKAKIAAWFGFPGGGVQYKLPKRIRELLGEYLKEV